MERAINWKGCERRPFSPPQRSIKWCDDLFQWRDIEACPNFTTLQQMFPLSIFYSLLMKTACNYSSAATGTGGRFMRRHDSVVPWCVVS